MKHIIFLLIIVFGHTICFSQQISKVAFKLEGPDGQFRVKKIIKAQGIYVGLSHSQRYLGYGRNTSELQFFRFDSLFYKMIEGENQKKVINDYVKNPIWNSIQRKTLDIDIKDSIIFVHGIFIIDRDFEGHAITHLMAYSISLNLANNETDLIIYKVKNQEILTAYESIFLVSDGSQHITYFDVCYSSTYDTLSYIINPDGGYLPLDSNLRCYNKTSLKHNLMYDPLHWSATYQITKDSVLSLYSNGYEIIDIKNKKVIFRPDSLYAVLSPLFLHDGKICVLTELLDHKKIMSGVQVLDRKIISLSDHKLYNIPSNYRWTGWLIIPKDKKVVITDKLEAIYLEDDQTKLVTYKF